VRLTEALTVTLVLKQVSKSSTVICPNIWEYLVVYPIPFPFPFYYKYM